MPSHDTRTLMEGRTRADSPAEGHPTGLVARVLGRRRTFMVDPSYQVRFAIIAVLGMAFLLVFAAAMFHRLSIENVKLLERGGPGLAAATRSGELRSVLYLVTVGLVFVAVVFAIEIFETHKTAGVVFKVTRGLRDIQAGRWGARLILRRNDNFKEMEEAFNGATRSLRDEVDRDLRGLQAIEGR